MGNLTVAFDNAEAVVGLAPLQGIIAGTKVLTLEGEMPVQFLSPGDRIITRSGAKKLQAIEVAVVTNAGMVHVSASALGHERPEEDTFVAPSQQILVRDWRAKALYGKEVALVEAQRLADGEYIRKETVAEVRIFTLRFEREEVVYAGGLELACAPLPVTA